jgi:hypothetical protein
LGRCFPRQSNKTGDTEEIVSMLRFSLFKTPRHKTFQYEPRFYDPEKEERQKRMERLSAEGEGTQIGREDRIRSAFKDNRKVSKRNIGLSQLMLIALLGCTAWLFFYKPSLSLYLLIVGLGAYYLFKRKGTF